MTIELMFIIPSKKILLHTKAYMTLLSALAHKIVQKGNQIGLNKIKKVDY